jgi:deoxycytidylate deaminase
VTPEESHALMALLVPTEVLQHVEARGWVQVPQVGPFWLLWHPDWGLRQLLIPKDATDVGYFDALGEVIRRLADIEKTSKESVLLDLLRPARPCTEHDALDAAVVAARQSPCAKSQRGVVVFTRSHGVLGSGWNSPPAPFRCDGSPACRAACNKLAVHAEMAALHAIRRDGARSRGDLEMLHVKVTDGVPVPSGGPSCWQCSREVLASGVRWFWLLHEDGLRRYAAEDFHAITLRTAGLPVIR